MVTFAAFHLFMPAGQCEPCPVMRKPCRRFPAFLPMTGGTGPGELAPMLVLMTTQALPSQAEEGPRFHTGGIAPYAVLADIGRPVTRNARVARMLPRQRESGPLMIKVGGIEPHDAEIPPVMFLVTLDALVRPEATVHAGTARDPIRNVRMATQTFLIVDVPAQVVTRGALVHAFQRDMRGRQLAGRDLGPDRHSAQCDHDAKQAPIQSLHVTISTNSRTPLPPQRE